METSASLQLHLSVMCPHAKVWGAFGAVKTSFSARVKSVEFEWSSRSAHVRAMRHIELRCGAVLEEIFCWCCGPKLLLEDILSNSFSEQNCHFQLVATSFSACVTQPGTLFYCSPDARIASLVLYSALPLSTNYQRAYHVHSMQRILCTICPLQEKTSSYWLQQNKRKEREFYKGLITLLRHSSMNLWIQ